MYGSFVGIIMRTHTLITNKYQPKHLFKMLTMGLVVWFLTLPIVDQNDKVTYSMVSVAYILYSRGKLVWQ